VVNLELYAYNSAIIGETYMASPFYLTIKQF